MSYATVEELAAALRVRVTAENQDALQRCLDAAAEEIDHEIDWPVGAAAPAGQYLEEPGTHLSVIVSAPFVFSSSNVMADPGPGGFRADKVSPANVAELAFSVTDSEGNDRSGLFELAAGGTIIISGDGQQAFLTVTAAVTDNGSWVLVPADYLGGPMALEDGVVYDAGTVTEVEEPIPSPETGLLNRVNLLRGVEWWKANDAAFGVIGFDQTGVLQAPRDGFARHAATLTPQKRQWGIA